MGCPSTPPSPSFSGRESRGFLCSSHLRSFENKLDYLRLLIKRSKFWFLSLLSLSRAPPPFAPCEMVGIPFLINALPFFFQVNAFCSPLEVSFLSKIEIYSDPNQKKANLYPTPRYFPFLQWQSETKSLPHPGENIFLTPQYFVVGFPPPPS